MNSSAKGYSEFNDSEVKLPTPGGNIAFVDRLAELRAAAMTVTEDTRPAAFTIDMKGDLTSHLKQFEVISHSLQAISDNANSISQLQTRNKTIANERQRKGILENLDKIVKNSSQHAIAIKKSLDEIKSGDDQFTASHSNLTSQIAMRKNLYSTHVRKFHSEMTKFNSAVQEFKVELQRRTMRELRIVDSTLTEEQISVIIESGKACQVISAALVDENLSDSVKDIEARHTEIMKLEQQIMEIFELFKDLQSLVDLQQESLDIIDNNISAGKDQTLTAETELNKAAEYFKKLRKRKCCLCFLILAILAVVGAVIATQYQASK